MDNTGKLFPALRDKLSHFLHDCELLTMTGNQPGTRTPTFAPLRWAERATARHKHSAP